MQKAQDRKLKERQERDELILDCAQTLLQRDGIHKLTMQAVAAMTDYSKGTLYQHYRCKEDLLGALVARCGNNLVGLIGKAVAYSGSIRAKIALMSAAFFYNGRMQKEVASLVAMVKSEEFLQKVEPEQQKRLRNIDNEIFRLACIVFYQAKAPQSQRSAQDVMDAAFGWWTMSWGLNDVMNQNWDIKRLGFADPMSFYFRSLTIFLDGLGLESDPQLTCWGDVDALAQALFEEELLQRPISAD